METTYEKIIGVEKPMRITRIVSVILNGIVLTKLAGQHAQNVAAMADALMINLSENVQRSIQDHEMAQVNHDLQKEIVRRMSLPEAV